MPRFNLLLCWTAILVSLLCYWKSSHSPHNAYFAEALDTIHERGLEKMSRQELFDAAIEGMAQAHDEHSHFISQNRRTSYVNELEQKLTGIGVLFQHTDDGLVVANTIVGTPSPAHDAGMLRGDRIIKINGESVRGLSSQEAVSRIGGPSGSVVTLTVEREGEEKPIPLEVTRTNIRLDSVMGDYRTKDGVWEHRLATDPRIAYFRLEGFRNQSTKEIASALAGLKKNGQLQAAIIDVRDNGGGFLDTAIEISNIFTDKGKIVETRGRDDLVQEVALATAEHSHLDFPVVVLVNGNSASASEIFSACLQDHQRATVIGSRTFGKGYVERMIPMERNRSILKLTTATYWRPNGKNIHRRKGLTDEDVWGVQPDEGMEVRMTPAQNARRREQRSIRDAFREHRKLDEDPIDDPQLKKAVEFLQSQLDGTAADDKVAPKDSGETPPAKDHAGPADPDSPQPNTGSSS
ncbi:MAG: S41 family peptidase [Planctomycetales bacterium]